jgi:tetratricopeptide (TPR) repeat protein
MPAIYRFITIAASLGLALTPRPCAQDEAAFDQGYAAVRTLMQKGKWNEAKAAIDQLLSCNAEQAYVQAQKEAIVTDYRLCAFWAETKVPEPSELTGGALESWSPSTGKIRLRYAPGAMKEWEGSDKLRVHPVVFAGPYTITVAGKEYPRGDQSLRVFLDLAELSGCVANFGFAERPSDKGWVKTYLPVSVYELRGDKDVKIDDRKISPAKGGAPYVAQVKVDKGAIELFFDKKSLLRVQRPRQEFGQAGIGVEGDVEVTLEGLVEPSWLQNLCDASLATKRQAFEERFRTTERLPKWLFEVPQVQRTPAKSRFTTACAKSPAAEAALGLFAEGKASQAIGALQKLGDADMDARDRAYLLGACHQSAGNPELALPLADRALEGQPEATHARVLRAEVWLDLGRRKDGLAALRQAAADDPGHFDATEALFVALMRQNDSDSAMRLVRDAKSKHGMWEEVAPLEGMLTMRARGPAWPRRFSNVSAHYQVHSDIDAKTCIDACRLLEESYVNLKGDLAWLDDRKDFARFEVYVFSGESGYQDYCKKILGSPAPHTAGLYSPVLKQLLIWNVPKREEMLRTIRHEGFHQFMDRAVQDPPTWLNEGMAEFWETARRENDKFQGGQPRPAHVAMLIRSRKLLPSLDAFVHGGRADFYENAQLRYAQAWAIVHFLRKGGLQGQRLFQALWDALRSGELGARGAMDKAFAGIDWAKLESEFWTHVLKLEKT